MAENSSDVTVSDDSASVTSKALDHMVDGVCAGGLVCISILGEPTQAVVAGLVTIALGKRAMQR